MPNAFNCTVSYLFSNGLNSNCAPNKSAVSHFLCVLHLFHLGKLNSKIHFKSNRRKPENLTPPLSSDGGSSTSGQSPTSTHNGSPPPAVKRPPLNSDKYTTSNDYPTSKKQRISHYRKDIVGHQDINIGARSKYHDL